MKKILGLDLGTNSIGWAVVNEAQIDDNTTCLTGIDCTGSRIIPMDAKVLGDFDKGNSISQTAERTRLRSSRRLIERSHLRRARLLRVLMEMNWLPPHYAQCLDRYGNFIDNQEPKIAWAKGQDGRYEFLFADSFIEMLQEFKSHNTELALNNLKVPYDWTIYYLRKKALTSPVTKYELVWILLNFNQKRGYFQLRDENGEDDNTGKTVEYFSLRISDIIADTEEKSTKGSWYTIVLENGWSFRRTFDQQPDWIGKTKDFIVTTEIDKNGLPVKDKDGNIKRSFRTPKEEDWTLVKKKTEADIEHSQKTVGEFIFQSLLNNPSIKIKGKLVRTIERKYYKEELRLILERQKEFHEELRDKELYERCIKLLYSRNEAHRSNIRGNDFTYLFLNDIIFYQRPLKSKKSLIDECPYEIRGYEDKDTGERHTFHIKCIAKSHPLFQEFRLWQFISNLRIYRNEQIIDGKLVTDVNITSELLPDKDSYAALYEWLDDKGEISMKTLLSCPVFKINKKETDQYRWNYPTDKKYPCNVTKNDILKYLKKAGIGSNFLTYDVEGELWHLLYSITTKEELKKGLVKFAEKYNIENKEVFVDTFITFPPFKKEYGAYSAKAIKKLLSLMRQGKFWNEDAIDTGTKDRILKILSGEYDPKIRDRVREKAIALNKISDFQGLPLWLACYIVYNRHSENEDAAQWTKPEDIDLYLKSFKQHSLHNPIVEQVILETLRTVRDIWQQVGHIDEIHIELGREMKNPADKRKKISEQISRNENTNLRIKAMLTEFLNPEFRIEDVKPYSPYQQEILKIYEENVLDSSEPIDKEIEEILKKFNETELKKRPTTSEILKYKLWLDQKYISPYTGEPIPLGKLFTPAYEIEHIIPKSRYFDDSLSNKVICESEVNKLKDKLLGHEFIEEHGGEIVTLNYGRTVKILTADVYEELVNKRYSHNPVKRRKLLMDDIPDEFIQRQLNDSRYISKKIKSLLSNIVRENDEEEDISRNVITCTGAITDRLKKDWGVNNVWNDIVMPRFERLESIKGKKFTTLNSNGKPIPDMPLEYQKGFSKKRIDHRHHAMDAIVIACANRNIVNYLNNASACKGTKVSRYDLQRVLCRQVWDENGNYSWTINLPWENFMVDVRSALSGIIVSFKHNERVINKTVNHYLKYDDEGKKKIYVKQVKGDNWAIRKPLHKDTVFGEINLRKIKSLSFAEALKMPERIVDKSLKSFVMRMIADGKDPNAVKSLFKKHGMSFNGNDVSKVDIYVYSKETKDKYFASRTDLSEFLSGISKDKIISTIETRITDTGIQKILKKHLETYSNDPKIAFSPDGIDRLNSNIVTLNDGRRHKPIFKVRKYEKADKFPVGEKGNRSRKFVEAAKGTNLYFAVYKSEESRSYESIPLNKVIDNLKQGYPPVPETGSDGVRLLFWLSPNDLVYLPTAEDMERGIVSMPLDKERIYKMVSCTGNQVFFIKSSVASPIINKEEFSSLNKMERAITGEMIKETCIPLNVDRLGNIINFNPKIM